MKTALRALLSDFVQQNVVGSLQRRDSCVSACSPDSTSLVCLPILPTSVPSARDYRQSCTQTTLTNRNSILFWSMGDGEEVSGSTTQALTQHEEQILSRANPL